jgi:Do/DeqQ family serine protease
MRSSLRVLAAAIAVAVAGGAILLPRWNADETLSSAEPARTGAITEAPPVEAPGTPAPAGAPEVAQQPESVPPARSVPRERESIRFSFAPVVKRVAPAVVNVYATSRVQVRSPFEGDPFFERFFGRGSPFAPRQQERSSLGSGVIVDPSGIVVTNNHVVGEASEVRVALSDGRELSAEILLKDERTDLAVLKIDNGGDPFPVLEIGDSDALEVGDLVLAVGNPFGVGQTVTSGIVSAVARTNIGINDSGFFIQTDAAINPGNSGGPLVDVDGRLVGVNTAIFSRSGGSIGIGFAVPSDMVRTVVAQAAAGSTSVARGWIGALTQDVTQDIAASLGLERPRGALVTHVEEGSPAANAGLQVGDLVLEAGGSNVGDAASFDYRVAVAGIGNQVDLSVWRDGEAFDASVAVEAEPELHEADLTLIGGRSPLTGAVVTNLSATIVDRMRLNGADHGAVIVDVEPRSPAARMGFRPGDVVLKAQGETVESAEQLVTLAETDSRLWRISFNRGGRISNIVIGG